MLHVTNFTQIGIKPQKYNKKNFIATANKFETEQFIVFQEKNVVGTCYSYSISASNAKRKIATILISKQKQRKMKHTFYVSKKY